MPDVEPGAGNGAAPAKRGRGRPPLPRAPLEAFSDQQLREAMAAADAIERGRTMASMIAAREADGLHPAAFRLTRKLVRQGPAEARQFYAALGRYLVAAGMLCEGGA